MNREAFLFFKLKHGKKEGLVNLKAVSHIHSVGQLSQTLGTFIGITIGL